MSVYHWLVILIVSLSVLLRGNRKGNTVYVLLAAALMFCVYGLRDAYSIGGDSASSYLHQFQRMEQIEFEELPDFSDWLQISRDEGEAYSGRNRNIALPHLMKAVYTWTDGNYQTLIIIISAFVMLTFAHFIRRYSSSPVQSILFYLGLLFYSFHFSSLKQSTAMSFVLLSFDGIMDRKPFRFLLCIFLGSLFHFPALVFLPAYLIVNRKMETSYPLLLIGLFVFTYVFRDLLVKQMTDVYETAIYRSSGRFLANKVLIMLFIIAAAYIIRPPDSEDRLYNGLLRFLGIAAVIQTFSAYNNTFERLADYYFQFAVILLPMIFANVKTEKQYLDGRHLQLARLIGPVLTCAFAIWRFLDTVTSDPSLYPFVFYFQR